LKGLTVYVVAVQFVIGAGRVAPWVERKTVRTYTRAQ
jgi:hypothetical protein